MKLHPPPVDILYAAQHMNNDRAQVCGLGPAPYPGHLHWCTGHYFILSHRTIANCKGTSADHEHGSDNGDAILLALLGGSAEDSGL